jgi:Tfp pilus assembly protein PilO
MKKSTKLLIGLLIVAILAIVAMNFVFKSKLESKSMIKTEVAPPAAINSETSDSLAMDSAINNQ